MSLTKRKGSPFWQYSFTVNGVRFRGSTGCEGKKEARQVEAEERHRVKELRKRTDPWRLRDCLGAYWSEHAKFKNDFAAIESKLDKLSLIGSDKLITDITNADLLDYRTLRKREGLQAHSVNRDFAYLKAAFNHARQMHGQDIPAIAWKAIKAKEAPHRIRFLSREEYADLLSVCDLELQRIVKVAVATGLRKSNLLNMKWSEVDLSSNLITVTVKGDKLHRVRITPATKAALVAGSDRKGKVFDTRNFRKKWDAAVKAANLQDFRFHDLRHTCATWMRMAGADLADICEALGHSSVAVTMRYAHIEPEHHITAFDRISERVWTQSTTQRQEKRQ